MKSFIKKSLNSIGIDISKFKNSPYEYLLYQPRYKQRIIDFNGNKFKISDAPSFYWSFREIFIHEIYKFESKSQNPIILDCGSNHGTSITYFKTIFPNSNIIGVEADPYIFDILKWNIEKQMLRDVTLLNKAVSNSNEPLSFFREGADGGRIYTLKDNKEVIKVNSITLDNLLDQHVHIDFLKMDIEGSESDVIVSSEKLGNVQQLFIEYHSFKDAEQSLGAMLEKLKESGFRYYIHTQFCSPKPLIVEELQLGMDLQLNIFAKRK